MDIMEIQDFYEDGYMNLFGSRRRRKLTEEERAWATQYPDSEDIEELQQIIDKARARFKTLPQKNRKQKISRNALSSYIVKLTDMLKELKMEVKTTPRPLPPSVPDSGTQGSMDAPTPPPPPPPPPPRPTPPQPPAEDAPIEYGRPPVRRGKPDDIATDEKETASDKEEELDKTKAPTTGSDKAPTDPKKFNKNYIYIGVGLLAALGVFMFMKKRKQAQV